MNILQSILSNFSEKNNSGRCKLRICGLSDPDKGLQEAYRNFGVQHKLKRVVGLIDSKVLEILDDTENAYEDTLEQPVLLIRDDKKLEKRMKKNGLGYKPLYNQKLFDREIGGYSFAHRFLCKKGSQQTIASVHIDGKAIDDTISLISEDSFKSFEKALGAIFVYTNHDYTMHRHGLALNDELGVSGELQRYSKLDFPQKIAGNTEVLSAMFHADMIREACERGVDFFASIEKQSRIILNEVRKIENPDLRRYWMTIIKYPLFSIATPEEKYEGESVIQNLRAEFPDIDLNATPWGEAVHRQTVDFKIGHGDQIQSIDVRTLRKIIMGGLSTNDSGTVQKLIAEISLRAGYQGETSKWSDLYKVTQARYLNLPDNTSDEDVRFLDDYYDLIDSLDGLVKGENIMDSVHIYDKMEKYKKNGVHFGAYEFINWPEYLLEGYTRRYKNTYKIYSELDDDLSLQIGYSFKIEQILYEAQERGVEISKITIIDWYTVANKILLSYLKKQRIKVVMRIESKDDFSELLSRLIKYNEEKLGKPYDLGEFKDYDRGHI